MNWWDQLPLISFLECWLFKTAFLSHLSPLSRGLLVPLCAIRVVSSVYLRLLTFLLAIFIPVCDLYSLAFCIVYLAYKLNKQGDSIQPWHTASPVLNQSIVPCKILTVASWLSHRFLRRQVRWPSIPISSRIFHSLLWSTQSKPLA